MAKIPVFEVEVPEYKIETFEDTSETVEYQATPSFSIELPKVYVDNKPDFDQISRKIDDCLKKNFAGKVYHIHKQTGRPL